MNEDIANFLILCSARDRLFLDIPDSDYVKNLKGDFTIKNKWMTDFIDNIEFPDFKQAAIDFWEQENKK